MYAEIEKLNKMLNEANIPHTFNRMPNCIGEGYQIRLYSDATKKYELDDAVYHTYSHGYELGLLETCRLNDCEGFETAEQVFTGWKKMYEKNLKNC